MSPRLRASGWPSGPPRAHGSWKLGRRPGMPRPTAPSPASKVNRSPIVATSKPGYHRAASHAPPAAAASATRGEGIRRVRRGQKTRMSSVAAAVASSGHCQPGSARTTSTSRSGVLSTVGSRRPSTSASWIEAITTAMPDVNPVVTGCGMNSIRRPIRIRPKSAWKAPARSVARRRPAMPYRAETGASSTTNAAVGPDTCVREPPSSGIRPPATIAV